MTVALAGEQIAAKVEEKLPGSVVAYNRDGFEIRNESLLSVATFLKTGAGLEFDYLTSITGVDYMDSFELIYHLEEMGWCELKSPVAGVSVGLSQVEKKPPSGGNAVLTWGVKNIEDAKEYLEGKGVRFDGDIQTIQNMVKLVTFYDPDGNCFMLYQDISR